MRRVTAKRCVDMIDRLRLEHEDLELDLDDNGVALNNEVLFWSGCFVVTVANSFFLKIKNLTVRFYFLSH